MILQQALHTVSDISFEDNIINYNSPNGATGGGCGQFSIFYSPHCHFRNNQVLFSSGGRIGFVQFGSIDNLFCCNTVRNGQTGFIFAGVNEMLNFSSNTMDNCRSGLHLNNQITPQAYKGNIWMGDNSRASILAPFGSTVDEIAQNSKFIVNSLSSNNSEMRPNFFQPDQTLENVWFEEGEFSNASCGLSPECGVDPLGPGVVGQVPAGSNSCDGFRDYIEALVGPKVTSAFQHQNEWVLFYYVFKHFDNLSIEEWQDCFDIYDFMNSNPKIESYVRAGKLYEDAFLPTLIQSQDLLSHQTNINSSLEAIQNLYDIASEDYMTYAPDIKEYQDQINISSNSFNDIVNSINIVGQANLNVALNSVLSLQTDYDFEVKLKTVWTAKIKVALYGITGLNKNEWQEVESIANGCPDADGLALFEARSLVMLKDGEYTRFVDSEECHGSRKRNSTDKVDNKLSVYPNPTSGVLNINGLDGRDRVASIKLYSMDGLVVLEQSLSDTMQNLNIELSDINAGIYILELSIDGIHVLTQKVVLTK